MEQSEFLLRVVDALESLAIPYFVTGSVASSAYGEPRFTNDIDVVVQLNAAQVGPLLALFPDPEFYVSRSAADDAVRRRKQFNIIHPASGLKADIIVARDSEFDRGRLARRRLLPAAENRQAAFASPEDVILKKMQFYQEGESEKHLRDIAAVLIAQGANIDHAYLESWVARLDLSEIWTLIKARLESAPS